MYDIKREYGLTNSEIANGLDSLSDDDFYEIMSEFAAKHDIDIRTESLGKWIDTVLQEIKIEHDAD